MVDDPFSTLSNYPMQEAVYVVLLAAPLCVAFYMLHQIDKAAKRREAPVHFWLVDLFSLIFIIQLPLTIFARSQSQFDIAPALFVIMIFCALMVLVWWTTIKTVSRAGVTNVFWRSAISILVIPMAYVGSFTMMGITPGLLQAGTSGRADTGLWIGEAILGTLMIVSIFVVKKAIAFANDSPT